MVSARSGSALIVGVLLVVACGGRGEVGKGRPIATTGGQPPLPPAACQMQENRPLRVMPLRAVGTEPFWAARIDGRCVVYSHPEDQSGTLLWTRYTEQADGGSWTGALDGQPFQLRTRARPDCSDGMSDKRYPIAVELTVQGERRTGCAEPT